MNAGPACIAGTQHLKYSAHEICSSMQLTDADMHRLAVLAFGPMRKLGAMLLACGPLLSPQPSLQLENSSNLSPGLGFDIAAGHGISA